MVRSKDGREGVANAVVSSLLTARGSKDAALQALDAEGFNTPENVDAAGTRKILAAWTAVASPGERKRFVRPRPWTRGFLLRLVNWSANIRPDTHAIIRCG